jgi:Domain of unknown function (DUF4157)/Annexin
MRLSRQHRTSSSERSKSSGVPRIVHEVLNSPGKPLDESARAYFEPRFGHDFSQVPVHGQMSQSNLMPSELGTTHPDHDHERAAEKNAESIVKAGAPVSAPDVDFSGVRIHSDARAADSAQAVNAAAYTVRNNIVFGAEQYQPETTRGRLLLAHELTHVVQQSAPMSPVLARVNLTALDFNAMADALHNAMAGLGTDEELIYVTLQKLERDPAATSTLRTTYRSRHGSDLENDIRDEMSGSELDFALELLGINPPTGPAVAQRPPGTTAEFEAAARRLEAAMTGQLGTDEEAVYATLLPLNRQAALATQLKATYRRLFGRALEDDIRDEMSSDELAYALYLLNAPPPAAPRGTFQTVPGGGTAPATAPPPVEGGRVSALTAVPYQTPSGTASVSFAVSYSGGLAADSRWLQFIWREIQVTDASGASRMLNDPVTIGARTYPLTTNANRPNYSVDSRSATDPFYEANTSTARREPDLTMIADAPTPIKLLVAREFAAGARSVTSRAHFEIFLIRDYRTLYHVGIDVEHPFTNATTNSTSRNIRVTETASELPGPLRSVLIRDYPAFEYIQ